MVINKLLQKTSTDLSTTSSSPNLDAEIILAHILKKDREYLFQNPNFKISPNDLIKYSNLIKRRLKKEPVAYLINSKEFYGINLFVDKRVLIPRPETEILVEEGLKILTSLKKKNKKIKVVDIGTGSGCISIALAKNFSDANYFAIDVSKKALQVTKRNIKKHKLKSKIRLIHSNLLENLGSKADLIIANLPYLTVEQIAKTEIDVKKYEPEIALLAGEDENYLYDKLLEQAGSKITKPGYILLEIDPNFKKNTQQIAKKYFPQANIRIVQDLAKKDRVIIIGI